MKIFHLLLFLELFLFPIMVVTAQDSGFKEKEVTFSNGDTKLSGTLIQPSSSTSPAIVYLHGSGPMTREGFRVYAEEFARLGISSLFFDKRGTGSSEGSWITCSLDDLARDAVAAIDFLKAQDGIDQNRIGLWGVSQAGWIASVAASKTSAINFMIMISGGGASPRESELFSYQKQFEYMGLSQKEIADGLEIVEQYFGYLAGKMERTAFVEILEKLKGTKLEFLQEQLNRILVSETNRPNWSWVANYDPVPDIEQIKCPVLLMFGDLDKDQPTETAVKKWREGLEKAGNEQVTISVFPGAAHGIRLATSGNEHHRAPFADGYWELQVGWLLRNVVWEGGE